MTRPCLLTVLVMHYLMEAYRMHHRLLHVSRCYCLLHSISISLPCDMLTNCFSWNAFWQNLLMRMPTVQKSFCQSRMSLSTGFVWQGVWGGCLRPLKYACGRVGLQTTCSGKQYKNKQKCASWLVKCLHSKMWSISGRTCIEGLFLVCTIFYFSLLHCVALSRTKTVSRLDVLLTVRTLTLRVV